jgi:hypothetical protein
MLFSAYTAVIGRKHVQVEPDLDSAVLSALDALGKSSAYALLYHLRCEYGIQVGIGAPISMKNLELALADMLGANCSELIMGYIEEKLKSAN